MTREMPEAARQTPGPREIACRAAAMHTQTQALRGTDWGVALRLPPTALAALTEIYYGQNWPVRLTEGVFWIKTPMTVGRFSELGDRSARYTARCRRSRCVLADYVFTFEGKQRDYGRLAKWMSVREAAEASQVPEWFVRRVIREAGLEARGRFNALALRALLYHKCKEKSETYRGMAAPIAPIREDEWEARAYRVKNSGMGRWIESNDI